MRAGLARRLLRLCCTALAGLALGGEPQAQTPNGELPAGPSTPAQSTPSTSAATPAEQVRNLPARPYADPFYNSDFSYLDDPDYVSTDPFDALKRLEIFPDATLDLGGEYSARLHNENNLRLDGRSNDFLLQHTRLYGDLRHDADWRVYVEGIDATISFERQPPRASEENRWDLLNLFGDLRLWPGDADGEGLYVRGGRQELNYGNQRLIAAATWANSRLTFDGVKAFWKGSAWDVDAFWTRPVPFAQHLDDHRLDHPDLTAQLLGVYASWHAQKTQTIDLYFLRNSRDTFVTASQGDQPLVPFDANTLGGRWKGERGNWLWEVESAYQFGRYTGMPQSAGFAVAGAGYHFKGLLWDPTFWLYYDWASGDADPTDGRQGTFNQILPQTHAFLGLADLFGRQNLEDFNGALTLKPLQPVTIVGEFHIFQLAQARDALYNNAGVAIRRDPTGAAGTDLGQELDVTVRVQVGRHCDVMLSGGHFFAGRYLANTGIGQDADFAYTWFTWKF